MHLRARVLARYQEGALKATKATRVAAHLSVCLQCSGSYSGLEAISRLLAATTAPSITDAVSDRIHAAIAAEAAARTGSPATEAPSSELPRSEAPPSAPRSSARHRRPVRASRPVWTSPLVLRGLSAAASVAVVIGVGYLFATSALRPSSAPTVPGAGHASRGGTTALGGQPIGSPRQVRYGPGRRRTLALASDTNYTPANLASLVRRDVANTSGMLTYGTSNGTPVPSPARQPPASLAGISPSQLAGCLTDVGHGRQVLVADVAMYLGRPATIIVLKPLLAAASIFDVVVVGPGCSRTSADVITSTEVPVH